MEYIALNMKSNSKYKTSERKNKKYRTIIIESLLPNKKKSIEEISNGELDRSRLEFVIRRMIGNGEIGTTPEWNYKLGTRMREKYNN
jgi:hypothetical protein